ncbi:glutaredoxin [Cunninghamella echinulata]|nr:glutaredoxin [Cunninghamella echinulata]
MAEIEQLVEQLIKDNKIAVFSKTYCPYCTATKNLFKQLGVKPEVIELDTRNDGAAIQNYLQTKSGQRTVPNIFINGQHIGGNSDLQTAHSTGRLEKLLTAA